MLVNNVSTTKFSLFCFKWFEITVGNFVCCYFSNNKLYKMNNDLVMDAAQEVQDSFKSQAWYQCKCIDKRHCTCRQNSTNTISDSSIVERMNQLLCLSSNLKSSNSASSLAQNNDSDSEYTYKYSPLEETLTVDNINECRRDRFSYSIKLRKRLPDISVDKKNKLGETAFHIACKRNHVKEIASLLDAGANINEQDNAFWTPLHEAVLGGNIAIVKLLLKSGSVVNAPGHNYTTPLHYAASTKATELCRLLVKYGANMHNMCFIGLTPMDYMSTELQQELQAMPSTNQRSITIPWPRTTVFYIIGEKNQMLQNVLEHFVGILDFTIADEIDQKVTHVIVNSKEKIIAPTYELLLAIVYMIPVITVEWLHACIEYDELLSYEDYYIIGTDKFQCEGVRNSQINKFKLNPKLFSHCNFYVSVGTGCKVDDVTLTGKQLEQLIKIGGGKILKREPTVQSIGNCQKCYPWHAPNKSSISQCIYYIVYDPKPNPILLYRMNDLKHVPYQWVYESILHFKLIPPELMQIP